MEYFFEFHWWYIFVGLILLMIIFGKGKGGIVAKSYSADLKILDEQFKNCLPEAKYCIFKEGQPEKIEIEVEKLPLKTGETLELHLNETHLASMIVKKDKEAEFEHWSDGNVSFPKIKEGDTVLIKYLNRDILKGVFQQN